MMHEFLKLSSNIKKVLPWQDCDLKFNNKKNLSYLFTNDDEKIYLSNLSEFITMYNPTGTDALGLTRKDTLKVTHKIKLIISLVYAYQNFYPLIFYDI